MLSILFDLSVYPLPQDLRTSYYAFLGTATSVGWEIQIREADFFVLRRVVSSRRAPLRHLLHPWNNETTTDS